MPQLTEHFSEYEMRCRHCGTTHMNSQFMDRLEKLRVKMDNPHQALRDVGYSEQELYKLKIPVDHPPVTFKITSGYRCKDHPVEKLKDSPGTHAKGLAADIALGGKTSWMVLAVAMQMGFTGIGIKQKGPGRFIHLDIATRGHFRPTIWSY